MFLHLDKNVVLKIEDIVAIYNLDNITVSSNIKEYMKINEKNKNMQLVGYDLPKSLIVCKNNKSYLVSLLSSVVKNRIETISKNKY